MKPEVAKRMRPKSGDQIARGLIRGLKVALDAMDQGLIDQDAVIKEARKLRDRAQKYMGVRL